MSWKNEQVSEAETGKILEVARECLGAKGDFVEMGCYEGDTSLLLAEVLRKYNEELRGDWGKDEAIGKNGGKAVEKSVEDFGEKLGESGGKDARRGVSREETKRLWIYDSFEGLPEKSVEDESAIGVDFKKGELAVTKREVKERFLRAGLPVPVMKKGWFEGLTEGDLPEEIAFAFLDGDLYKSIRDSLRLVGPKMAIGGAIIVHDYYNSALPGVEKAVDEWLERWGYRVEGFQSMVVMRR